MKKMLQSLTDSGRIVRAFSFSLQGLRAAYRKESAFRQELILAAVLLPLAVWPGGVSGAFRYAQPFDGPPAAA